MSDPLTILVTASGAPGSPRLLRALREADGRPVRLVGVDMRDESAGRFLCDRFRRVPPGSHPGYLEALLEVAEQEHVDVVFPQSSAEVGAIAAGAERFGVPVLVSGRGRDRAGQRQVGDGASGGAAGHPPAAHDRGRRCRRFPGGGGRARLPGPRRLHEAARGQGLARLPGAVGRRRPARTAAGRAAGHPAAPVPRGCRRDPGRRRGVPRDAGDGAGRGRGAGGGRALPERPHAGRKREDARGVPGRAGHGVPDHRPARPARALAPADRGASAGLDRERPVPRRPPARDQPAHLDPGLPARPEPALAGRAAGAGRDRCGRGGGAGRTHHGSGGGSPATTTRSST